MMLRTTRQIMLDRNKQHVQDHSMQNTKDHMRKSMKKHGQKYGLEVLDLPHTLVTTLQRILLTILNNIRKTLQAHTAEDMIKNMKQHM